MQSFVVFKMQTSKLPCLVFVVYYAFTGSMWIMYGIMQYMCVMLFKKING